MSNINIRAIICLEEEGKMEEDKILDFIFSSKWYAYRKEIKNQELNVYGKEMGQSLSDEVHTATEFLKSIVNKKPLNLQKFTILKLELNSLYKEFINEYVKYKLESIREPYQTREGMLNGWYE